MDDVLKLQQQIIRLQALLAASRRIHSTIQLDEVLRSALDIVVRELELEGAFYTAFPFSEGHISPRCLLTCSGGTLLRGCVAFPLLDKAGGKISDLVVIPGDDHQLSLEELDFLESLALQVAVAIENARHHERALLLERVEFDLASARSIQRSLLPKDLQNIPGYQTSFRSVSCYEVGGDYLDVFMQPSGHQVMIVADVAGKGMTSALVASSFRAAFRAMARTGMSLPEIATQMNARHHAEGDEARQRYVTTLFLSLDPSSNVLECVNAGHNPALLRCGKGRQPISIHASGPPVGMMPTTVYSGECHEMQPGACLLAYTDGLTEVAHGEEEFGMDRLSETFRTCVARTSEAVLDRIWDTIQNFTTEREPTDDMTALVLLRN